MSEQIYIIRAFNDVNSDIHYAALRDGSWRLIEDMNNATELYKTDHTMGVVSTTINQNNFFPFKFVWVPIIDMESNVVELINL